MTIHHATTPDQIRRVYSVMRELRPHLSKDQFVEQVERQMREFGYTLIYIEENGLALAAAGYRRTEMLHWGKVLYIDDLVTAQAARGRGCADHLFNFVVEHARREKLAAVHLDSGSHAGRYDAHRFYLKHGMNITSYHFVLNLKEP